MDFANIPSGQVAANFIGVKVGDVNESATTFDAQFNSGDLDALMVYAPNKQVMKGEVVKVPLELGKVKNGVVGYQFSLDFDQTKLELVDLNSLSTMVKVDEHFGDFRDKGMLTTSWNDLEGMKSDAGLFEMTFVAKASGKLSDWMTINDAMTPALAFDEGMEDMRVALAFADHKEPTALDQDQLLQNQPNPFQDNTLIPFYLAEANEVQLRVVDLQGRIIYEQAGLMQAGHHQILLQADELRSKGMLMYQLTVGTDTYSKRMVLQ
ncbi:MAG: T9SS type A sorting domain-containing protein [Saprospiraceae bacterium]|nr:T9SS type A sorting domain-containing protein [Saprospiraceae bacterium]